MDRSPKSTPFPRETYTNPSPPTPPSWSGIKRFGNTGGSIFSFSCCSDSQNNIYVAGSTNVSFNGQTLNTAAGVFILKYDSSGILQWSKIFDTGTETITRIYSIVCDSNNDIYALGTSSNNFNGETRITTGTNTDVFLLKLNTIGNTVWTKLTGSTGGNTYAGSLSTDQLNNVYICGHFTASLEGNPNLGNTSYFIKKYNTNGTQLSLKIDAISTSGTANTFSKGIKLDSLGNIYVCGVTTGSGPFGTFTNAGWLVKYNSGLSSQWTRTTANQLAFFGIATDNISGPGGSNTNIYLEQRGDGFVKYDSNGNLLVTNIPITGINPSSSIGIASNTTPSDRLAISTSNPPEVYVSALLSGNTGLYTGNQSFNEPGYTGYTKVSPSGSNDGILSRYSSALNKAWTSGLGSNVVAPTSSSPPTTQFNGVCLDSLGNIYVCGVTKAVISGTTPLGVFDGLLLKYNSSGSLQ